MNTDKHRFFTLLTTLFVLIVLTACGASAPPTATQAPVLEHVDLGVGFIPNVQFAPFYVAQRKGFYAAEGLEVTMEYGFENDFVALTAQGERQFAVASGDQVILARAQGLPVVYIMQWYNRFPVGVMAPVASGIDAPEKLAGHSVGIPGLYGASYVAWQALVYATGLDESSITLKSYPDFSHAAALSQGQVDAAVVYIANEPLQLEQAGTPVNVIQVSDYIDLVSNGLITNDTLLHDRPDLARRMVRATVRGLEYTLANPDEAFAIVRQAVPEITDADAPTQRAVLDASIALWKSEGPLGHSDPAAWATSVEFMRAADLIAADVEVESLYTNKLLEP